MWPISQKTVDLVTFTEEIIDWKHFLSSVYSLKKQQMLGSQLGQNNEIYGSDNIPKYIS